MNPLDVVWDMETADPDDFLTLILLCGHPAVNLKAVTVTPGSQAQIGLVRFALREWFGLEIPVGAGNLNHPKSCVAPWHYRLLGTVPSSDEAEPAGALLRRLCGEGTTLITGAPLKNLGKAMEIGGFRLGRLVAQGGFAGEGIVPPEHQLAKFKGFMTCPTYNLDGDVRSALRALACPGISERRFVSKNVCHGVVYGLKIHRLVGEHRDRSRSLSLIWAGMEDYLGRKPSGKKLHDPFAACCAIDPSIATWAEVELFKEKGGWGARPSPGSRTWIITGYDREKFLETFLRAQ